MIGQQWKTTKKLGFAPTLCLLQSINGQCSDKGKICNTVIMMQHEKCHNQCVRVKGKAGFRKPVYRADISRQKCEVK